jgi:hypothetical protein
MYFVPFLNFLKFTFSKLPKIGNICKFNLRKFFVKITLNGKSIGEVRAFEELKVQGTTNGANAFSIMLTYKKLQN